MPPDNADVRGKAMLEKLLLPIVGHSSHDAIISASLLLAPARLIILRKIMKVKITNLSEISKENNRFCLSAHRALGQCYKCRLYDKCKDRLVNKKYDALIKKRLGLFNKIKKISKEIESL